MKKRRICLVIPSLAAGGMERVMSGLAAQFAANDSLDVHLVMYGSNRVMFYSLPPSVTVHNPEWNFDFKKRIWHGLKTLLFLRKKITSLQPDTVLSFGERWNNMVLFSLLGTGLSVYIGDRSQPLKNLGRWHNRLRNWLYPKAAGLILQTAAAKEVYRKKWPSINIKVIGNPVKQASSGKAPGREREKIVLMVGRIIKGKHHDRLIRTFAALNRPDWKLVLVGQPFPGPHMIEELQTLAADLGVSGNVIFTGGQTDVEQFYLSASIFAFTSSSEGFPNVVGEAMSAGLPVVSYDCFTGPSEMIRDGKNGFLVAVFDDEQFAQRLSLLMDNRELREMYGKQAQQDIQKFAPEAIAREFLQFITSHY